LMARLVELLAETPHRYVVSRGPRHDEYELADNMVGAEFLPQTSVLAHVDAVVTHGGNNTVTESMWFGKPMVVLPIFWDQHDNAQRVDEVGFGIRLPTYDLSGPSLVGAVDRLLSDHGLRSRAAAAGERLRSAPGTVAAADLIERVAGSAGPIRTGR
jgi:UDP:flavonoid glycosyltransferase YjiC (YdhE family)